MNSYAAFLRGIGPSNPNMRNDKLRSVFEGLGLTNVRPVISSGNILFDSDERDTVALERRAEKALLENLGIKSTTIIRSKSELQSFEQSHPFEGFNHARQTYLTVTLLKDRASQALKELARTPPDGASKILSIDTKISAICALTDTTVAKTPDFMLWLERQLGKDITTRTWQTIKRIVKKMEE